MIDPHDKVSSVQQDEWIRLASTFRQHAERTMLEAPIKRDDFLLVSQVLTEAMCLEKLAMAFDDHVEHLRANLRLVHWETR